MKNAFIELKNARVDNLNEFLYSKIIFEIVFEKFSIFIFCSNFVMQKKSFY